MIYLKQREGQVYKRYNPDTLLENLHNITLVK